MAWLVYKTAQDGEIALKKAILGKTIIVRLYPRDGEEEPLGLVEDPVTGSKKVFKNIMELYSVIADNVNDVNG